jgi:C4-dicarboxylate transporter/malic acid transport protein
MAQTPDESRTVSRQPGADADRSGVVRNFAPSWFASVMGTGALALGCASFGHRVPVLAQIGLVLHWFNVALFIVLFIPWTLRWILYRSAAMADLRNPVVTQFYPTVGVGLLILCVQFQTYGGQIEIAAPLWAAGVLMTLIFSIVVPFVVFRNEGITLDHVSPGMFIPPVALVVIPLGGAAMIRDSTGLLQDWLLFLNYACLGAGFFLYLAILALTFQRFVLGKVLPGQLVPTIWINLGPIGVVASSIVALTDVSPFIAVKEPFTVLALLLWGFGVWWLAIALVLTGARLPKGNLPFALSWWAFTFPLGSWALGGARLGTLLHLQSVWEVGFAAFLLLCGFWSVTLLRTLDGVLRGTLFLPPSLPKSAS